MGNSFNADSSDFTWLVGQVLEIVDIFVVVVFALTFTVMIWQIVKAWIIKGGDEMALRESKRTILIGIVVLVVMSAVWGIVALLQTAIR